MKTTQVLASAVVAGTTLLGFTGAANAASALRSYHADSYAEGKHAFWLRGLADDGYADHSDFYFDSPGMMTEWDKNDDGQADFVTLTGTISNKLNSYQSFDVDLTFNFIDDWDGGTKGDVYAGGRQNALDNWDFYSINRNKSFLTGTEGGAYEGSKLKLFNRAFGADTYKDGKSSEPAYVLQVGDGANDKNDKLGASVWFGYTGKLFYSDDPNEMPTFAKRYKGSTDKDETKSDFNLHLIEKPQEVPEPTSFAALAVLAGVAVSKVNRKKPQPTAQ